MLKNAQIHAHIFTVYSTRPSGKSFSLDPCYIHCTHMNFVIIFAQTLVLLLNLGVQVWTQRTFVDVHINHCTPYCTVGPLSTIVLKCIFLDFDRFPQIALGHHRML